MEQNIALFIIAQLISAAAAAGGVYAAIRADMREYRVRIEHLERQHEKLEKHKCQPV